MYSYKTNYNSSSNAARNSMAESSEDEWSVQTPTPVNNSHVKDPASEQVSTRFISSQKSDTLEYANYERTSSDEGSRKISVETPRDSARGLPEGSPAWARQALTERGIVNEIEDELISNLLLRAPTRSKSFRCTPSTPPRSREPLYLDLVYTNGQMAVAEIEKGEHQSVNATRQIDKMTQATSSDNELKHISVNSASRGHGSYRGSLDNHSVVESDPNSSVNDSNNLHSSITPTLLTPPKKRSTPTCSANYREAVSCKIASSPNFLHDDTSLSSNEVYRIESSGNGSRHEGTGRCSEKSRKPFEGLLVEDDVPLMRMASCKQVHIGLEKNTHLSSQTPQEQDNSHSESQRISNPSISSSAAVISAQNSISCSPQSHYSRHLQRSSYGGEIKHNNRLEGVINSVDSGEEQLMHCVPKPPGDFRYNTPISTSLNNTLQIHQSMKSHMGNGKEVLALKDASETEEHREEYSRTDHQSCRGDMSNFMNLISGQPITEKDSSQSMELSTLRFARREIDRRLEETNSHTNEAKRLLGATIRLTVEYERIQAEEARLEEAGNELERDKANFEVEKKQFRQQQEALEQKRSELKDLRVMIRRLEKEVEQERKRLVAEQVFKAKVEADLHELEERKENHRRAILERRIQFVPYMADCVSPAYEAKDKIFLSAVTPSPEVLGTSNVVWQPSGLVIAPRKG